MVNFAKPVPTKAQMADVRKYIKNTVRITPEFALSLVDDVERLMYLLEQRESALEMLCNQIDRLQDQRINAPIDRLVPPDSKLRELLNHPITPESARNPFNFLESSSANVDTQDSKQNLENKV